MKKYLCFCILLLAFLVNGYGAPQVRIDLGDGRGTDLESRILAFFDISSFSQYTGDPFDLTIIGLPASDYNTSRPYAFEKARTIDARDLNISSSNNNCALPFMEQDYFVCEELKIPQSITTESRWMLNSPTAKKVYLPEGLLGFHLWIVLYETYLEDIYLDNPEGFDEHSAFQYISPTTRGQITLHLQEGATGYEGSEPWGDFDIKYDRRKVIFHMDGNESDVDRVSFTYPMTQGEEQYYWYSTVGELMETPRMDNGSVYTPVWYTDEARSQIWNFDEELVPASDNPDSPTPLHLYAEWSRIVYHTVKLDYNYDNKILETEAEGGSLVWALVPENPSRTGYRFEGWFVNEGLTEQYEPGTEPIEDETTGEFPDGVKYLDSDLTLYAKWVESPWLLKPIVVEIPEGGTLQDAWDAAFAAREEHTDKQWDDIYAIARLEIRGHINDDAIYNSTPGFAEWNNWYANTLLPKVRQLDLREASYTNADDFSSTFTKPVDGVTTEVFLPQGRTEIGRAYHMTYSVTKLHLPVTLATLEGNACNAPFSYTPLSELYIDAPQPPAYSTGLWHSYPGHTTIYVPEGVKAAYEAEHWADTTTLCVWKYKSKTDGGGAPLHNVIEERPKVTFHTNGGSRPLYAYTPEEPDGTYYWYVNAGTSAYSENFPADSLPVSERDNAAFLGWYTDEALTTPYDISTSVNLGQGGLDLYAKWAVSAHTVTFKIVNLEAEDLEYVVWRTDEVGNGETITAPNTDELELTRPGFDLIGWRTDPDHTHLWNFDEDVVTSDTTLYVVWEKKRFTVTFNSQGGSAVASQTIFTGDPITDAPTPTRANYDFDGWFIGEGADAAEWDFEDDVVTSDTTLYAKWTLSTTGTCGENLTWILHEGTLTVRGTGAMTGYTMTYTPWISHRTSITKVVIEEGVTSIGSRAFYDFPHLTEVSLPESLTSIGNGAFAACANVGFTSVVIPDGVTIMGREVFAYCNLTTITIGSSVTVLGDEIFMYCPKLTTVICRAQWPPQAHTVLEDDYAFVGVDLGKATLYVPDNVVNVYEIAPVWKDFKAVLPIGALNTAIETPDIDGTPSFYPNPAADFITIGGLTGTATFTLFDLSGKPIISCPVRTGDVIPVALLTRGVYIVNINGKTHKLLKR